MRLGVREMQRESGVDGRGGVQGETSGAISSLSVLWGCLGVELTRLERREMGQTQASTERGLSTGRSLRVESRRPGEAK